MATASGGTVGPGGQLSEVPGKMRGRARSRGTSECVDPELGSGGGNTRNLRRQVRLRSEGARVGPGSTWGFQILF